jgi:hypothetical protein
MNNINDVDTHHFFALDRVALAFVSLDLVTTCGSVMSLGFFITLCTNRRNQVEIRVSGDQKQYQNEK